MDKIFAESFVEQPDEIINGDYFYRVENPDESEDIVRLYSNKILYVLRKPI